MKLHRAVFTGISQTETLPEGVRSAVLLASSALFQGTLYMDPTERRVKLGLTFLGGLMLSRLLPPSRYRLAKAFGLAHLLNFVTTGQPWVAARGFGVNSVSPHRFEHWIGRLERLGHASDAIALVAVYGSHVRGEWDAGSDLDVRVVRYPGLWNGVVASLLVARERVRANLTRFPLDVYVFDSPESLSRLRDDERPTVLVDEAHWLDSSA
jgi:predicted nucleotidyltransferase